jgi:putative aminopeptidase FrvX
MLNGIPANERQIRLFVEKAALGLAEISHDNLGSVILEKVGSAASPRIMVAGHMDEIGLMITEITKDGYLKFIDAGGWWGHVLLSQQFTITTIDGREIRAVVGSKPPHILEPEEKKKVVELNDMYLDIGVQSETEARALGIRPGDMVTPSIEFTHMANPKYLLAKAFDDRIGVAIVLEVLKELQKIDHPNTYVGVGTVQEEVGLRGAVTASHKVKPDIGISLDVTVANDFPGGSKDAILGKGPCLMIYDSSMVGHVALREFVISVANENGIPYQISYLKRGGTDAGKIHLSNGGCPSIAICLASRYIHSHTSMIHEDDYLNTIKLILALLTRLDEKTVKAITYH